MAQNSNANEESTARLEDLIGREDEAGLSAFLAEHPSLTTECGHPYPYFHRVLDLSLGGKPFRLGRCVRCGERLTLTPIDPSVANLQVAGVPLEFKGEALRKWVEKEAKSPAKEAIDWDHYDPDAVAEPVTPERLAVLRQIFGQDCVETPR